MISNEVRVMKKEHQILLGLVLPVLAINLLGITTIHAADDATETTTKDISQTKGMPAAPAGPYRSLHDMKHNSEPQMQQRQPVSKPMPLHASPNFNNRQWTTPTPPQWNQAQQQGMPIPPPQWNQAQPQQRMPIPEPQWNQAQPQQRMPMPAPQWNQEQPQQTPSNFNNRQWMPPQQNQQQRNPQRWNQQQWNPQQWNPQQGMPRQQQMAPQQAGPNFNNNRQWTPPTYTPYPQNRGW